MWNRYQLCNKFVIEFLRTFKEVCGVLFNNYVEKYIQTMFYEIYIYFVKSVLPQFKSNKIVKMQISFFLNSKTFSTTQINSLHLKNATTNCSSTINDKIKHRFESVNSSAQTK